MKAAIRVLGDASRPSATVWRNLIDWPGGGWTANTSNSVYYNGNTYFGYIDPNGNVRVSSYNHAGGTVTTSPAIKSGLSWDKHNMPSVLVRSSDHKLLVAFSQHDGANLYISVSTNAEDVSSWGAATDIDASLGGASYTYCSLFQLSGESGKIYLFYRDGSSSAATLCYSTSTDAGATWSAQTSLYSVSLKGSYWAIDSDDTGRIDIVTSDGTAKNGDTASMYHFYYSSSAFHKSDGTTIAATKPYGTADVTKFFDGATNGSVRAPLATVTSGSDVYSVWAAYDTSGSSANSHYWWAHWNGTSWANHTVTDTGSAGSDYVGEGGIALDRAAPATRVYISKRDTSKVWQLHSYTSPDSGATWAEEAQITNDTGFAGDGVGSIHPIIPRSANSGLRCIFLTGSYSNDAGSASSNFWPFSNKIRGY